jgi:hypothetical protein
MGIQSSIIVQSPYNGNEYLVRRGSDADKRANMLARIDLFISHVIARVPRAMQNRWNAVNPKLFELPKRPDMPPALTYNRGEGGIGLCLDGGFTEALQTIVVHEMAHVFETKPPPMSQHTRRSIHGPEFKRIEDSLLLAAKRAGYLMNGPCIDCAHCGMFTPDPAIAE